MYGQKNLLCRFCLKSCNIIDFDTFLQNRFRSLVVCTCVSIHTQLSVVITVKFTMQFSEKQLRSLSHFGLSLYWNNIFTKNYFHVVLSKPQRVKLTHKSKRQCDWNLPFSETISMVSSKQPRQYWSPTPHTLRISKTTNCLLEIAAYNHGLLIQYNSRMR